MAQSLAGFLMLLTTDVVLSVDDVLRRLSGEIHISHYDVDSEYNLHQFTSCDLLVIQNDKLYPPLPAPPPMTTISTIKIVVPYFSPIDEAFDKCFIFAKGLLHDPENRDMLMWFTCSFDESCDRLDDESKDWLIHSYFNEMTRPEIRFLKDAVSYYKETGNLIQIPGDKMNKIRKEVVFLWFRSFKKLITLKMLETESRLQSMLSLIKPFESELRSLMGSVRKLKFAASSLNDHAFGLLSRPEMEVPEEAKRIETLAQDLIEVKAILDIMAILIEWREQHMVGGQVIVNMRHTVDRMKGEEGLFRKILDRIGRHGFCEDTGQCGDMSYLYARDSRDGMKTSDSDTVYSV